MSEIAAELEQLVVFSLAEESYGVDIGRVNGIERMQEITKIPRTDASVEGVINLRGRVIPVVDLRKVFMLPVTEETKDTRIVVVDISGQQVGCLVDAVTEVLRISSDSVEPPSSLVASSGSDYLLGIAKLEGRMIILLDLEKALSIDGTMNAIEEMDMTTDATQAQSTTENGKMVSEIESALADTAAKGKKAKPAKKKKATGTAR